MWIPTDGTDFEGMCAELFEKLGFTVTRTGASGDQGADLVMTHPRLDHGIAVQCKLYSHKLDNTPIQEVVAALRVYGCSEGWVVTNGSFTDGARQLAAVNDVKLIDGDQLNLMEDALERGEDPLLIQDTLLSESGLHEASSVVTPSVDSPSSQPQQPSWQATIPMPRVNTNPAPAPTSSRTYTLQDVADRWGCSPSAVRKEMRRGLPLVKQANGRFAIDERDLVAYENAQAAREKARKRRSRVATAVTVLIVAILIGALFAGISSLRSSGHTFYDVVAKVRSLLPGSLAGPSTYTTAQGITGDVARDHSSTSGETWIRSTDSLGNSYYRSSVYIADLGETVDIADYGGRLYYVADTGQPITYESGQWHLVSPYTPWTS